MCIDRGCDYTGESMLFSVYIVTSFVGTGESNLYNICVSTDGTLVQGRVNDIL